MCILAVCLLQEGAPILPFTGERIQAYSLCLPEARLYELKQIPPGKKCPLPTPFQIRPCPCCAKAQSRVGCYDEDRSTTRVLVWGHRHQLNPSYPCAWCPKRRLNHRHISHCMQHATQLALRCTEGQRTTPLLCSLDQSLHSEWTVTVKIRGVVPSTHGNPGGPGRWSPARSTGQSLHWVASSCG